MSHLLLDSEHVDVPPRVFLGGIGVVFAEFGENSQDSGNVSYGVQVGAERFFVKTAGEPGNTRPYLDHAGRVALLRNVARLYGGVQHSALPTLLRIIESPEGPMLVFPWIEGELLGAPREQRDDPMSAYQRFRALPAGTITSCLEAVFDLHVVLERTGWIAVDFYDGSLMYDFTTGQLWMVDLDSYSDAPFTNEMGRMFGSSRFMAPEEFELGARIDARTTVFVMGRTALIFLGDGSPEAERFRGSQALLEVAARACNPKPERRFDSMAAFREAWLQARREGE